MNKRDREAIHKAFVRAVPHLASGKLFADFGKMNYICWAIQNGDTMYRRSGLESRGASLAMHVIHDRIRSEYTLVDWLAMRGISRSELTHKRVQIHRHKWLQMLIKEFSK